MKTLFIYTNINGFHEYCYSFGLASIVSVTIASGHEAKVTIVRKKDDYSKVFNEINDFKPQIIGFTSVSSQFYFVKEIAALIKMKFPNIITVCGGVHPTINPECVAEANSLDGVFVGESENSFVEFLEKTKNGESYENVDNLSYVKNGKTVINKLKQLITNLDGLPYPDKELFHFEDVIKTVDYAPFLFSRGCPYSCSYCSNHAIAKAYGLPRSYPRYRSPESSICEIEEAISKFHPKMICIADDTFGFHKKWREEFCEKYKKRIKRKFVCFLRADIINKEFIRLLKDTGCCRISIGVESGNEHVRNNIMNRQMSSEQIVKAFELAHKHGIQTNSINIIGAPGEAEKMIWDTILLNRKIKPTETGVNIFYPYKGTRLGDYCFEKRLVDENLYHTFSNERRESILNYPEEYKKKLVYYRENWGNLVYPFDLKRRTLKLARKMFIWKYLRKLKRHIVT